ncbi:hypothetical protein [Thiomicrorhabdus sp.]|uniref:hypothetical protein n=1 Tax=Thiomicrorhabdus sp. TaxID=2039724 RepID=UPI0029C7C79F|nr:hypothetical protein [Thiomicrorhabdus sp.]
MKKEDINVDSNKPTLEEKLKNLASGKEVEFTEEEVRLLSAFKETALNLEDAEKSRQHQGGVVTSFDGILEPPTFYTKSK